MTKLETIATKALAKSDDDIDKALPHFVRAVTAQKQINELAREYLRQFVGRESGQALREAQRPSAGLTPPTLGSIKVTEHDVRQHRRRTHEEKEADRAAMMASVEAVFEIEIAGRVLGNVQIGELASLKRSLIDDASNKLMLGADQVRNAVLIELIEQHSTVQDQLMKVREAHNAKTLVGFVQRAEQIAPRRITEAMRRASAAIEQREIAP